MTKHLSFLLLLAIAFQSCVTLNGNYCTPADFVSTCAKFDRKQKMMYISRANCTGASIRKGKYKRLGNLLILDLIPYEDYNNAKHKILVSKNTLSDSIQIDFKVLEDSISREPAVGAYIILKHDNGVRLNLLASDFEGLASVKIAKTDLPLMVEIQYIGKDNIRFPLSETKDATIECEFNEDRYVEKSKRTGREYYRVKRVKKHSLIIQQVFNGGSWKIDSNWYENQRFYSKYKPKH